jgi:hypothetical protein
MIAEPFITPAQLTNYQRFARDVREKNEQGVRRWKKERRILLESKLRNLTVLVAR